MIRRVSEYVPFGKEKLGDNIQFKLEENGVELCWTDNEIIWSKNRCLLHDLHMPGEVVDATLCTVDNREFLAVLYKSGLTLFSVNGQSFLIPLPFQISRIFALHKALLLFRSESSALIHSQYSDFPILFTLYHPLEEIRPVAFFTPISIASPLPKYTVIPSPNHKNDFPPTPPTRQFPFGEEDKLRFITDLSFIPLQITKEQCYLLARSNESISIWKFTKQKGNRDLLYSSRKFARQSVFSPVTKATTSPGSARAEIKATLEGIPPDLFMEMIFEFTQIDPNEDASLIEVQDDKTKLLLFLHKHQLQAINVSNVDANEVVFTIPDVMHVCRFEKLMYFVVTTSNRIILYEEGKAIVQFPFENIQNLYPTGNKFVMMRTDGTGEVFQFKLTFDPVVKSILEAAHQVMNPDEYASVILALSESDCLHDCDSFIPTFVDLLLSFVSDESTLRDLLSEGHCLFQQMKLTRQDEAALKLINFLLPLTTHFGLKNHILYYALHSGKVIEDAGDLDSNEEVQDILFWCSQCITGKNIIPVKTLSNSVSRKVVGIFSSFNMVRDMREIVRKIDKSELDMEEFSTLHPAVLEPLKRALKTTAESPPDNWPLDAYQWIGRADIKFLKEYIAKPTQKSVVFYEKKDLRFIEVERLLQSHMPVTVDVERPNGTDDIQFQAMLIEKLKILLAKQWSLSVGRGLFDYQTFEPLPSQSIEKVEINLSGFTTNAIELKAGAEFETPENMEWPQFHNGVADGLSVFSADHTWLLDAATKDMTSYSAGVLFGFGLTGQLKKFWKVDLYQYMTSPSIKETNACALLLGLGLTYRGARDLGISHMFTLHIPELRQFQQTEYDLSPLVQSSATIGIGLLFEASGQRHITETFLSLLERSAIFEVPAEPFALGAAIGLVNLGLGDESNAMRENRERLCVVFSGSKSIDVSSEKTITFGNSDFFAVAPAAILALTLGYMRTDHSRVKLAMELPKDAMFVNSMLPDVVLMRTMGSLIIDSDPNTAINFTVPDGLTPEILAALVTGFAIACGVKMAGTLNRKAFARLQSIAKCLCLLEKKPFDFTDCPVMRREESLALVLLSCSLIIAGTCDVEFLRFVRYVRRRPVTTSFQQYVYGIHMILGMAIGVLNLGKGRYTIGTSNSDSAAILMAMFPRFTKDPSDNCFMMQPIRHFLAAAAVPRVLEIRDVDTDKILSLSMCIGLKDGTNMLVNSPHVLPPFGSVTSVSLDDPGYYSVDISNFPFTDEKVRPIIWMKKRSTALAQTACDVDSLRTLRCMKQNRLFGIQFTDKENIIITRMKTEWDQMADEIMRFLRSTSVSERSKMLKENSKLKDFLCFYGLLPSVSLKNASVFDDEALAFVIPYMTPEEVAETFA